MERCQDNSLVIEIWNFGKPSQLVGVCMAPLQQFHSVFKVRADHSFLLKGEMSRHSS